MRYMKFNILETVSLKKSTKINVHHETMTRSSIHKLYFFIFTSYKYSNLFAAIQFYNIDNWFAAVQFDDIACVDNPANFFFD